jgi:uncharacterized protein (DUF362 family)
MNANAEVFLIGGDDLRGGMETLLARFPLPDLAGKTVAVKANFNSADRYPASTDPATLGALIDIIAGGDPMEIVLAERSGMGATDRVLERCGVYDLANEKGFSAVVLDDLDSERWANVQKDGFHWRRGFPIARLFLESDVVVQTCCLKTHRFGGHFTMSLKNSVGMVAKYDPQDGYNYMQELHTSPAQRLMIAEINTAYTPDIVLMDARKGFSTRGPERGTLIDPDLLIAGTDRVAVDAVGVALLRLHGSTREVMRGSVFDQEQIARAAELGVGVASPDQITLHALDAPGETAAGLIRGILDA